MSKKPSGFVVYPEHVNVTRLLSNEERGLLLLALSDYAENKTLPEGRSAAFMTCFELMKNAIDRQQERYKTTCERNRKNVMKRWSEANSSNLYDGIRSNTTDYDRIPDVPMDTNYTNQTEPNKTELKERAPRKRFTPPTVEEVDAYCREHGYDIDAQQFVKFYEASDWMRGRTKIKNWKACVVTWVKRQEQTPPQKEGVSRYAAYESN